MMSRVVRASCSRPLYALREEGLNAHGHAGGYHVPPATLTGGVTAIVVFVEALMGISEVANDDHR